MPLKLEIPDIAVEATRELYYSIAKEKYSKLMAIQKEWESLKPILDQLNIDISDEFESTLPPTSALISNAQKLEALKLTLNRINDSFKPEEYNQNWSWGKKITHILRKSENRLTAKQIVEIMIRDYEPGLSRQLALNSVPATLSVAAREGKFTREMRGEEYLYGVKR